jgi:hypothetical protein
VGHGPDFPNQSTSAGEQFPSLPSLAQDRVHSRGLIYACLAGSSGPVTFPGAGMPALHPGSVCGQPPTSGIEAQRSYSRRRTSTYVVASGLSRAWAVAAPGQPRWGSPLPGQGSLSHQLKVQGEGQKSMHRESSTALMSPLTSHLYRASGSGDGQWASDP